MIGTTVSDGTAPGDSGWDTSEDHRPIGKQESFGSKANQSVRGAGSDDTRAHDPNRKAKIKRDSIVPRRAAETALNSFGRSRQRGDA